MRTKIYVYINITYILKEKENNNDKYYCYYSDNL